jgi:hypothetical protein
MTANNEIEIPKLTFNATGDLMITASPTSSMRDFDFFEGKWRLHNRKLKVRLGNSSAWEEFESSQEMYKVIKGLGNVDNYLATFDGVPFEGMSVRLFNPQTRLWSIYWADSNQGILQPPVAGSFENGIAHFFAKDTFNGRDIVVVFRWDARDKNKPVWSQAFSADKGETWEWNWYMYFSRF